MIVSLGSSHTFAPFVIWNHVGVVRKLFFANRTDSVLLGNLAVEQLLHLSQ